MRGLPFDNCKCREHVEGLMGKSARGTHDQPSVNRCSSPAPLVKLATVNSAVHEVRMRRVGIDAIALSQSSRLMLL